MKSKGLYDTLHFSGILGKQKRSSNGQFSAAMFSTNSSVILTF